MRLGTKHYGKHENCNFFSIINLNDDRISVFYKWRKYRNDITAKILKEIYAFTLQILARYLIMMYINSQFVHDEIGKNVPLIEHIVK